MDIKGLKIKLNKLGINENLYSLYGKENPDTTVLKYRSGNWVIYGIDERGNRHMNGVFETKAEACEFIYQNMVEFKWIMKNAHIHPDNKPKKEDILGFEVTLDGEVKAILKQ